MARNRPSISLADPRADVATLRAFVAVARSGTVGRAAELLGRTQPSVSARLSGLEEAWGTRLFRRQARGMALTPEGARLLPLAESVLRDLEALDQAAGLPLSSAEALRVGAGDALGRERLPRALKRLLVENPALEVHLREGPAPGLLDLLRDGQIDLALVVVSAGDPSPAGIEVERLLSSPVVLLGPAGKRTASSRAMGVRSLRDERIVSLQPGSGFRRHVERAFAAARVPFRPAVEVGSLSLVRRFVAAGLGVAPVPAVAFEERAALSGVERRKLAGIGPVVYASARRHGVPPGSAERRLLELLAPS